MTKQAIETMISRCEERIESFRKAIEYYKKLTGFDSYLIVYYKMWETTLAIKQRLENYKNSL